jgi:ubiquinone/menaquinone biosynthesis C-methylase UbiE
MSSRSDVIAPPDTLRAYDQWAAHYDADDNPLVAATGLCLRARPLEVAGARVVELGCGTGRNAAAVLAAGAASYTGVDGSAGMLGEAKRRVDDARCTWIEARLDELPAAPGGLHDAAMIVLVLEHLTELGGTFRSLAGWLRPGASLRILELHPDRIAAGTVAHFHDAEGVEHRFTSTAHAAEDVRAALEASGFAVERLDEVEADEALIAAVPRLAKHRGKRVVLDVLARRR